MKKGIYATVAGLLLLGGLAGCGSQDDKSSSSSASSTETKTEDFDKVMDDVNQDIKDKNFKQANKDLDKALKIKENNQQAENIQHQIELYQAATKAYNDGQFATAKKSAQALVQSDGSETMMNYGKDLLNNINKQVKAEDATLNSEENAYNEEVSMKAAKQVAADKANMNKAVRVMDENELKQNDEYAKLLKEVEAQKSQSKDDNNKDNNNKDNNDDVTVIETYTSKSGAHGVVKHHQDSDVDTSKEVKHYIVDNNGNVKEVTETQTDHNGHKTNHETEESYHE